MTAFTSDQDFYNWQIREAKLAGKTKEQLLKESESWMGGDINPQEYINDNWDILTPAHLVNQSTEAKVPRNILKKIARMNKVHEPGTTTGFKKIRANRKQRKEAQLKATLKRRAKRIMGDRSRRVNAI